MQIKHLAYLECLKWGRKLYVRCRGEITREATFKHPAR
uniref:Uncharacterized protein n=1 Tax=Ciceribacter selenitireducens ATCC BAA-1503 TaxID=1336235 RepID=A0A380TKR6_9HYPH|nr:unnamed protein product [Ciceribacter selenitireducens ATCC BAA-1503]